MSSTNQVVIGETTYTIQRFRGLKAILAIASITRIAREVPDILNDAINSYQKRNMTRITEPMSRLPRWKGFTKEDFDAAERDTGERVILIPSPMTDSEQILQALPDLLDRARKEVIRLFAILIIPNNDLMEADKSDERGAVEQALDKYKDILLYDAELDQLADLALIAQDVLGEQLGNRQERLGKLATKVMTAFRTNRKQKTLASPDTLPTDQASQTEPTSIGDVPTSLIDSLPSTGGPVTTSSMESRG